MRTLVDIANDLSDYCSETEGSKSGSAAGDLKTYCDRAKRVIRKKLFNLMKPTGSLTGSLNQCSDLYMYVVGRDEGVKPKPPDDFMKTFAVVRSDLRDQIEAVLSRISEKAAVRWED